MKKNTLLLTLSLLVSVTALNADTKTDAVKWIKANNGLLKGTNIYFANESVRPLEISTFELENNKKGNPGEAKNSKQQFTLEKGQNRAVPTTGKFHGNEHFYFAKPGEVNNRKQRVGVSALPTQGEGLTSAKLYNVIVYDTNRGLMVYSYDEKGNEAVMSLDSLYTPGR